MTFENVYREHKKMLDVMLDKQGFTKDAYEVKRLAIMLTALGKQINKDVVRKGGRCYCPTCKHDMRNAVVGRDKYCIECGQRLYWGREQ